MRLATMLQTHAGGPYEGTGNEFNVDWDFGLDLMSELLSAINYVSKQKAPFKIETEGYKVYWTGTVLRVDINQTELE